MNYLPLIIAAVLGIVFGAYFSQRNNLFNNSIELLNRFGSFNVQHAIIAGA